MSVVRGIQVAALTGTLLLGGCRSAPQAANPSSAAGTGSWAGTASPAAPKAPADAGWRVSRVVDGDTIWVTRSGRRLKVRLLGIDTPETVDPGEPVGCFGPEASAFATALLSGATVSLEYDASQGRTDAYGRTLAYVWLGTGASGAQPRLFNFEAVRQGFARQYRYDGPYAWYDAFVAAERAARTEGAGLWRACPDAS
jgi:micrococcal nuclease